MSNWEEKRFEDIVEVNPTTKLKKGKEYAFIDIDKVSPALRTVTNTESKIYDGQGGSKFIKGDTVFSRITPCLENRKIAQVNIAEDAGFGSTEFYVFRARENKANESYVYYLGSSDIIALPAINSMTGASGRQRADKHFIERIKLKVPDLSTQKRIADILSSYDDLIENNNKRIKVLESMAENLYKEWFVRFRFPGYETTEFENGIPKGWEVKRIGDICKIKSGYAFKSEWWTDEGIYVIKIKDINGNTVDLSDLSCVTKENAEKAKQFKTTSGDLLVAMTGATIGKLALVPKTDKVMLVNQRVGKFFFNSNKKQTKNVGYIYLTMQQKWIQELILMLSGSNAAQPNISPFDLEKIKVLYDKDTIEKFNNLASSYIEMILKLQEQNQNLIKQRDLLLPRLMSGKLEATKFE